MDQQQILSALKENKDFLKYLTILSRKVPLIYKKIDTDLRAKYRAPEAQDVRPGIRRAEIESALNELPGNIEGVEVRAERNKAKNSWHREVRSGPFLLTASFVNTPSEIVRVAEFRKTLAADSQLPLFTEQEETEPANHCYGIILHGKTDDSDDATPFLRLAFPSRSCDDYLLNLDLYAFLGINTADFTSATGVEEIDDEVQPMFKPAAIVRYRKDSQ